ncbi:protein bark beetle-like [Anneissia japonica]|uniref:protein bark beetle-like n=1 Tax=Anneissia japonica TaxID=1529436 RepID=UPI00142569D0|nr:protein bark beetle-like [Anneissia japonica]
MDTCFSLWLCFWFAVSGLSLGISSYDELGGEVTNDIILNDTSGAYTVTKMLTIARNTTLTIDPGCRLLFQHGTGIVVMGSLVVLGTSDNRVAFEPEGGKVLDTGRSSVAADIRLSGATTPREGRLEMYFNGHWTSICSNRWDALKSSLACHLLGYTTGAMHPVVIDDDDYWLDAENDWMMDFNCHGNESSFRECTFSEELDYGSYIGNNECEGRSVVGLRCEGEGPRYGNSTWAGITWMNADSYEVLRDGIKMFRSTSRLYHADVNGAGITHDLHRRPALESYGVPPLLASVKVEYSFGDGVNFKDLPSETEIIDSTFSHNCGLGLSLSSAVTGRVLILTSEISYNGLGGLQINHTTNPSDMHVIYDGLCNINATENFTYPVYIRNEVNNHCEMVFRATGSQHVLLRIYEDFGYLLEVRDGDSSTGPVIASSISASTYAISTGSSLWVRAKSLGLFRKMLRLLVTTFEEISSTFELGDVYIHNNRFDGMTADLDTASIHIRNSFVLENELNGVQLEDGDGIHIESLVADRNSLSGMKVINTIANTSITNSSFNNNGIGLTCQRMAGMRKSHIIVSLTESTIQTNQKQGILLDSSEMSVKIVDNYISENGLGGLVVVAEEQPLIEVDLLVVRNIFEDNSHVTLDSGTADTARINIANNLFSGSSSSLTIISSNYSNCAECYLSITNNTFNSIVTSVAMHLEEFMPGGTALISNNLFQNITCMQVIKISSNTKSVQDRGLISIKQNRFVDNAPFEEVSGNQQTSSLVSEVSYIFLRHNFFMDLFDTKLIIVVGEPTTVIPAQLNWWGSVNENEIQSAIIDKQDHMNLASVDFFPYLASPNISDIISQRIIDNSTFIRNGYVIGGIMNENITLQAKDEAYIVDKNIIICQSCIFTLKPGVKMELHPYTGIHIHGRIDFSGSINNPIELYMKNVSENVDKSEYRLSVGEDSSEGILLENHDGVWQPLCVADDDKLLQHICMKLGYQGLMEFEYLQDGSDSGKDTSCTSTDITCKTLASVSKPCNNGNQVYLKCVPIKWAGIRFFADARSSIMNHVIIREAGSHFYGTFEKVPAIQVDYHRHTLNNILISGSLAGMMVMTSEPFNTQVQTMNISINGCQDDMYAFKAIFPPFSISNITISNCNLGVLFEGFTSTELIEFNQQLPIGLVQQQCYGNKSLEHEGILYFSLENEMAVNRQRCVDTISTNDSFVIGVFVVYERLLPEETFSVYDDAQSSDVLLSVSGDRHNTYAIISTGSTVVLEYTRGHDQPDVGELVVIVQALKAGSVVDSQLISLFWMSDMNFDLSGIGSGSGIEVKNLERHHSLNVTQSSMRINGVANGLTLQGHGKVSLDDVTISDVGTGIQMDSFAGEFTMFESDLTSSDVGIEVAGRYTLSDTTEIYTNVLNSRITNSTLSAIHIRDEPRFQKTLNIEGCNFTGNYVTLRLTGCNETVYIYDVIILQSMRGIEMNDYSGNIFVKDSFISARDRALEASSTTPFSSNVFGRIESTHFTGHTYIVMNLREFAKAQSIRRARDWSVVDCTFQENSHVIKLDAPSMAMASARQSLMLSGCTFIRNEGTLINIMDGSVEAHIVNNTFYDNRGSSIYTDIIDGQCVLNISTNTFYSNDAGIEYFVRLPGDITSVHISNNQFINNVGHNLIYIFDSRQIHRSKILPDSLIISFNNITGNKPDSKHRGEMSCAVRINIPRGSVTNNILNNGDFLIEICSNAVLFDESFDVINATYNWWGTTNDVIIENRVVDISDRNDIISIEHSPYLTSDDLYGNYTTINSSRLDDNTRFIGGKIKGELTLTLNQSPYEIESDITVLQNSLLTVEAGVVLQFHPNIGILVLGDFVADGKENGVIVMESIRSKMKSSPTLRLTGGKIPSEGRLEMLINNKWTRLCRELWTMSEATVACGQMGYAAPVRYDWSTSAFKETVSQINNATFTCRGNELELNDCFASSTLCEDEFDVGLMCVTTSAAQMGLAWGGLRIMTMSTVQKTGSTIISSSKNRNVILRYLDIYDAGYLHDNDGAALSLSHVSPIIEDVRIFNSVSKGIEVLTPLVPLSMERVLVNGSASHGITLTRGSDVTDVVFDSVEILGNDIGLQIVGFTGGPYVNEYVGLHDICSMEDVTVSNFLMGYFDRHSKKNSECTVIIRAAEIGASLAIAVRRVDFTPGKDTLLIFDGSEYDGKLIGQFAQSSAEDTLALESTGDSVTLKMLYAAGSIKRYYIFEITTKTEGELSYIISTSTIAQSKRNAIWYTGLDTSFEISQCHVVSNNNEEILSVNNNEAGAVHVVMDGGNLNISQCVFEYNKIGALSVDIGRSNEIKAKEISVAITENDFVSNIGSCTLTVSSYYEAPIDTVTVLLRGNIIENNTATDRCSVIGISGVQLSIEQNLIKENLGRTLDWTGIKSLDNLVMVANTFFYNKAERGPTIYINGKGSNFLFTQNSFTDLDNVVELTAVFDDNTSKRLHAALNWWGMTSPELIQTRVETDDGENQGNIEFTTKPSLQTPLTTVYDFDCPIGFMKIGVSCYQLRSSVRGYGDAVEVCKKLSAVITSVTHVDVNAIQRSMTNRESRDRVWVYLESDTTESEFYPECSSYDPVTNVTSSEPCDQRLSFVCKTFTVGTCHEPEIHVDDDIGSGNDLSTCDEVSSCSMRGRCIAPNICHCYVGFQGKSCRNNAPSNERPPRFSGASKNISIAQSSPRGTFFTQVKALDKNYETNEPFCYHLIPTEFTEKLHLNSNSGMVHLKSDAKKMKQRLAHFLVAARDAGSPPKSSMINISVTLVEASPDCPVFSPESSYLYIAHASKPSETASVQATVVNGNTVYYALYEHAGEGRFQIDVSSGLITLSKDLAVGLYSFVVTAYTKGVDSCVSGKNVMVDVRQFNDNQSMFPSTTYRPEEISEKTLTKTDVYHKYCDTIGCKNEGICTNKKCICPCPFAGEFCQKETHCIEVSMKIKSLFGHTALYDLRLGDRADHLFYTYAEEVQKFVDGAVYSNDVLAGSYIGNTVTRFLEGSLIVEYQVTFETQSVLTDNELRQVLKISLSEYDGDDEDITVDPESITLTDNTDTTPTQTDTPSKGLDVGGGMIAIIIIISVGIIIVVVVAIVLLIRRKRKRRSYYNNLQANPIKMTTVKREPANQDSEEITYQDRAEPLENNFSEDPQ